MRKPKGLGYGWRHFPYLHYGQIVEMSYERAVEKFNVSHESRLQLVKQYKETDIDLLRTYRAILKSRLSAWNTWISTIQAFKFTMVGAVCGSLISLLGPEVFHIFSTPLTQQRMWEIDGAIVLAEIVVAVIAVRLLWHPSRVINQIERATFLMEILDEAIGRRAHLWHGQN